MRKVVHICWSLGFGGIETMLTNIANEQVKLGAEVSVIIINDVVEDSLIRSFDSKVKVFCLQRKPSSFNFFALLQMNHLLLQMNSDVVHLHSTSIYPLIFFKQKYEICVTLHDLPTGLIKRTNVIFRMAKRLLGMKEIPSNVFHINKIKRVFAISDAVKVELKNKYNINSTVIHNGVKTSIFKKRNAKFPAELFRMVQVGRLVHVKKGQDLLIQAVAKLKGKVAVDFIGTGTSEQYLKQLAKNMQTESSVHFLGDCTQDFIYKHLSDYDLFVHPSRWEGFGLTVAEAMSAKVPVLVSSGQGPAEITCGDKYGWVFKNDNVEDLISQIEYIRTNYCEALQKAELAHTYVKDRYDVSITAQTYLKFYDE